MATLKLQQKKSFSEQNMRKIINTLVGLMSSVSALEDQCIKEYDETKTYSKGQIVIGSDGYFYEAKTVASGVFDSSKWTKIGTDSFTELTLDEVKDFLSLTPEQLTTLSSIIKDDSIELSKTWSSSKSYMKIDNALKEAKQYCLTQLASKSTGSFKIATSESEVVDGNYLYLIMNSSTSKYDIFALIDGNVEKLTTVDIDLSQYFTKSEIEADFLKKADADGKFATITTVDGKVDKTNIATSLDDTVTDEQVTSALLTKTELDKLSDSLVDKADKSYVDDNFATMDKVADSIIRESRFVLYNLNNADNIEVAIDITKSGYKPIAVSLYNSGIHFWFAQGMYFNDTICNLSLRGFAVSSATNAKCEVLVTYIKTS